MAALNASSEFNEAAEYLRHLRDDPEFAFREIITIKNKQGQPVPFNLFPGQKKYQRNKARVNATIKIRQQGLSVFRLAQHMKNARLALFYPEMRNKQVTIFNKSDEDSATMFNHIRFMDAHLPKAFQGKKTRDSAKAVHYEDTGWLIRIMTAGKSETQAAAKGRSSTDNYLEISEAGFIEYLGTLLSGALGSLPSDGEIGLESTSSGPRGFFSQYCLGIMQNGREVEENVWAWDDRRFMFFGFLEHPEYFKPIPQGFKDEDDEEKRLLNLGADPGQIMWRRAKLDDYGRAQVSTGLPPKIQFKRDYPATWQDAFEEAGGSFYNKKVLTSIQTYVKETWPEPVEIGLRKAPGARPERCLPGPGNTFTIFKLPVPGWENRYIFFADVAQGRPDGDFDVGYIGDLVNREVVAKYRARYGADLNGENALLLCAYFFNALLNFDVTGIGSEMRPTVIKAMYTNLWTRYKVDNWHMEPEAVGLVWDKSKRSEAVGRMRSLIEGREWANPDPDFYEEADFFGYHDQGSIKPEAATGFHDDCQMTQAGLVYTMDHCPHAPRQVVVASPFQDANKLSLQKQLREIRRLQGGDFASKIAKGFNHGV